MRRFGLGVLMGLALSCASKDPSGATAFCQDYAAAMCDREIACGLVGPKGREDCLTYLRAMACGSVPSAARGYLAFDTAKGRECLKAVTTTPCGRAHPGCYDLYSPASETGEGCFTFADCKDETDACAGMGCAKTCQPAGKLGQPCLRFGFCTEGKCDVVTKQCVAKVGPGARCESFDDCDSTSACDGLGFTCVLLPGVGQSCRQTQPRCGPTAVCQNFACVAKAKEGAECVSYDACEEPYFCDGTATPFVCTARRQVGGACGHSGACIGGLVCSDGVCTPPKAEGQPCTPNAFTECVPGIYCDRVSRSCTKVTYDLKEGDACTGVYRNCALPLTCKGARQNFDGGAGTLGTCGAQQVGDFCFSSFGNECAQGTFCDVPFDGGPGACALPRVGSTCFRHQDCLLEDYCAVGACAPAKPLGKACKADAECLKPLSCVTGLGGALSCGKLSDVGGPCSEAPTTGSNGCVFPLNCVAGSCKHAGAIGERCLAGSQRCIDGACGDAGICEAKLPEGFNCGFNDALCATGRCVEGQCAPVCL